MGPGNGPGEVRRSSAGLVTSRIVRMEQFRTMSVRGSPDIEERHAEGDDFENAIIDAGILRLRSVLITVFATVSLSFRWRCMADLFVSKPLCYAQI
jgi:hypothetical protein